MEKYDTSQLTEFPRFESESNPSGVSTFFNKLWKFPIFSPTEAGENSEIKVPEKLSEHQETEQRKQEDEDVKTEPASYAVELEGRSLPNVLRRISSLVALGSGVQSATRYADTELARYWMPDDISRECYECAARFGALRRRHHCRVCGQIFCSRCCSQRVPGQIFGCAGGLRVCTYCCNVVLSYLRDHDVAGDISPDLRTLHENLQVKFPENREHQARSRDMFSREQDEREARACPREALQEALHDAFRQIVYTLPTQQHRYRLVRYIGVWRGSDIMQWVMDNTSYKTRSLATLFCQELLAAGLLQCAVEPGRFADYALYRPARAPAPPPDPAPEQAPAAEECNRLVESVSSYCLDLNVGTTSARLIKATKTESKTPPSNDEDQPNLDHNGESTEDAQPASPLCRAIAQSGEEHLRLLARQCVARCALPPAWADTVYAACTRAADLIAIDMMSSDFNVRNYVQVKKVPGGAISDTRVLSGVVLTKNVAHRGMPQQISNPTVLLLDCSIAYQRVEGKLTSLEPVLMQEQEYLSRCAARIAALRPRVVLVRGGAARAVQAALREQGVALAAGVRERALRRAARCARADLLASVDARIGVPRLGTCEQFYVKNYGSKTLMVLEGCAEPQLGCCILLRGGSLQELIRVKKVVKFMLLACYNWKLEKAFLADVEATLPEPGTFVDDVDGDDDKDKTDGIANDKDSNKISATEFGKTDKICDNLVHDDNKLNISEDINDDMFDCKSNDLLDSDRVSNVSANENPANKNESGLSSDDNEDINKSDNARSGNAETTSDDHNEKVKESESDTDHLVSNEVLKTKEDSSVQKKPLARKTDSDKNLSCGVPIRDFSDPLRSRLSGDDDVFLPKEEATLKADSHSERWCTDDVVLSMSPNVVIPAPPAHIALAASAPAPHTPRAPRRDPPRTPPARRLVKVLQEAHPFIKNPIASPADDPALRAALAHYRATGCRLVNDKHKRECAHYNPSVLRRAAAQAQAAAARAPEAAERADPLSPEGHQRLALLVYSYCSRSPNVPDFCVNPWIVTMEMYGWHDISLGAFLERYCFSAKHKCPDAACHLPMNQHVRRFVHGDVCITITCNTIGHSNVDKHKEEQRKQVMFWSRCERCGKVSHGSRLSRTALCLSLAQYVRARLSAPRYTRAQCPHPLNEHSHAFVSKLTTACFRYNKISTYDIQLPPDMISVQYDTKQMRDALIAQLNDLMLKGHEIFSSAAEGEGEKEYAAFKQHMEGLHLALSAAPAHTSDAKPVVVRNLWSVSDHIIAGEKMLRDAQDKWASLAGRARPHPDTNAEEKFDSEDSAGDAANGEAADNSSKELEREHGVAEEDEERGDKKSVKQILAQLLPNSQQQNQNGIIMWSGLVPVVVRAGETGSVIAAALASPAYQRGLRAHRPSNQTEQEEDNAAAGKDKADGDKAKDRAKANERYHIEVLLKDGLPCRVYYAPQFHRLRHMLLAPLSAAPAPARCCDDLRDKDGRGLCEIEEGFIRSLAHCVPWAARGGKSGSTFCKTKDDRYVLKEMTKPEWQQFLEFAPHYFNYVTSCRQKAQPSLLARILGVFSVGGAGGGVLVVEHVWYGRSARAPRFDLKGTSRARPPAAPAPAAAAAAPAPVVLLDDNLLRLRWETQLYVQSGAGAALWAAIERDTQFLEDNHVMDYSLLLSIDGRTLVLGIIDYIRTFTWDKKLEHLVKKNLGSGQPTVLSPHEYRQRFAAAARKYFLHCPQHWDPLVQPPPSQQR